MIAARFWIGAVQSVRKEHRWRLDISVTGVALAFSGAIVIAMRPEPLSGLLYCARLGVIGAGICKVAEKYLQKAGAVFGIETRYLKEPNPCPPCYGGRYGEQRTVRW